MTTQTHEISISSPANNPFLRILTSLIHPPEAIKGDERRKATSLAALTLLFLPLAMIAVLATPIIDLISGTGFTPPNIGGVIGIIIIFIAYGISRTIYHKIGAYLIIAVPIIAVTIVGLTSNTVVSEAALFYMTLSIVLSSLLLSSRDTLLSGFAVGIVLVFLWVMTHDGQTPISISALTYTIIAAGIMSFVGRIRERNLEELATTQKELVHRIADVEEARRQAERSDQVKSAFLASMSHELRTPLNAIINFSKFVAKGDLGPVNEEQEETLYEVVDSAKHLLNLINDVLDMSKIESGSLNLFVTDDVDLKTIINQVTSTGKSLLDDKPVEIRTELAEDLPQIRGDRQRITQILLNIMSNACKFTEEGMIDITAKRIADKVLISIADTGPGIAEEDHDAIFEPFKQTDTGLRQGGGTGLGMPITKNLVEEHGGELRVNSQIGEGATFTVSLPIKSDILVPVLT